MFGKKKKAKMVEEPVIEEVVEEVAEEEVVEEEVVVETPKPAPQKESTWKVRVDT